MPHSPAAPPTESTTHGGGRRRSNTGDGSRPRRVGGFFERPAFADRQSTLQRPGLRPSGEARIDMVGGQVSPLFDWMGGMAGMARTPEPVLCYVRVDDTAAAGHVQRTTSGGSSSQRLDEPGRAISSASRDAPIGGRTCDLRTAGIGI